MNKTDLDWLLTRLHNLENRRIGKTFAAAALTKKVNGILLTFNEQSAKQIRHEYEVDTASIQTFNPHGSQRPVIIDQDAFAVVCRRLLSENEKLEDENRNLKHMLRDSIWMARRYAHGRRTFAPTTINEVIDEAIKLGVDVKPDEALSPPLMYAEDGSLGKWDSERQQFERETR